MIIRRRDKVVTYWIRQTNPLDRFAVRQDSAQPELSFDNAAVRVGAATPGDLYKVRWFAFDNTTASGRPVGNEIETRTPRAAIADGIWGPMDNSGARYAVAEIHTMRADYPAWSNAVSVTLRDRRGSIEVVGIQRPAGSRLAALAAAGSPLAALAAAGSPLAALVAAGRAPFGARNFADSAAGRTAGDQQPRAQRAANLQSADARSAEADEPTSAAKGRESYSGGVVRVVFSIAASRSPASARR